MSSAKCVSIVKATLKNIRNDNTCIDKIGHMGTLDPMGCGVLLLGVGKATRLFNWYLAHDKTYIAYFAFGYQTDTLDCTGKVLYKTDNIPTLRQVQEASCKFVGELNQLPPQFCSKSVGGVRAYKYARVGKVVDLKPSMVKVHSIKVRPTDDLCIFKFEIACSSGTYIRSLCRDIARYLDSFATMTYICRTRCDKFELAQSVELQDVSLDNLLPMDNCLPNLPKFNLPSNLLASLLNGVKVHLDCVLDGPHIIYCGDKLFGIASTEEDSRLVIKSNLY